MRTESILVPFRGDGSGTAELTWGQWQIWPRMRDYPSVFNMGGSVPCPPGTTIADFVDIVRFMMGRYQALRTRLRFDADGTPYQVVATSGRLPLEIVEAADDEDPIAVAHAVEARYQHTAFDYEFEWPLRIAVIRQHDKSTHSVVMLNHLAVDAASLDLLAAGFVSVADRVTDDAPPLVQAAWQHGKSGQRTSGGSLRSWERLLRDVPFDRFGSGGDPRRPRYWQGAYRSPAGYLAVRAIADREQADTAAVVLAAIAVSLARITGNALSVWQLVVSNRFRPGLGTAIGPVSQHGLCAIDLAGITFREAVVRARGAILAAGMNGYYDPRARDELLARLTAERGRETDITCVVNDRRRPQFDRPLDRPPAADEIVAAVGRGELRWDFTTDRPSDNFFVHVNQVPDMLDYAMCADTHRVGVDELVACLRGVEEVAVEAALDEAAMTGVSAS
ncbi:MAG TPA: condensation domain-containing protein [Pseudonocardiaceae bacterium]|nr:condensation domain-containing protein [Pseudonocardiaceae bacterium]